MIIDPKALPTPVAKVAARLNVVGPESSADTFLITSYLAEVAIKTIATVFYAGLLDKAPDYAYRMGYELVRADGLGSWEQAIRLSTTLPTASYFGPDFSQSLEWITRRRTRAEDEWYRDGHNAASEVLSELGVEFESSRQDTVRTLLSAFVQIRNKTKAHGAVGEDFFSKVNAPYIRAVSSLINSCPMFVWQWLHLSRRLKGDPIRGVFLQGAEPRYMKLDELEGLNPSTDGIYFCVGQTRKLIAAHFISTSKECKEFFFPNGGFNQSGQAESVDYASGTTIKIDFSAFLRIPTPLPRSETHGLDSIEVQSNVFGNLPALKGSYVHRHLLEEELESKLLDRNHAIITLHGSGGVGKTYLTLAVAHKITQVNDPRFEAIMWISGRDVDLRATGPHFVKPAMLKLEDISKRHGELFGRNGTIEDFAEVLHGTSNSSTPGMLFIFDNFETMENVRELHKFLDTYTHLPNKVLITSRERAFKADYPIEVRGMERPEAIEMMRKIGRELGIEPLLTPHTLGAVYEYTKGHAYVMRVVVGEMAKEGKYVPPSQIMSSRIDIVNAVFERSFTKMTDDARWIFLTVSNWKSRISELALVVVLGQRGVDVEAGLEECLRLSLIQREELQDGQPCYSAPQLARVFGRKKLEGEPDRLVIQEDLETIRKFGVVNESGRGDSQESQILRFIAWIRTEARSANDEKMDKLDSLLEILATFWPDGWLELAAFRELANKTPESIDSALRRAVEECPYKKEAWLERAKYAQKIGNEATRIASLVSAVDAAPTDAELVRDVATQLGKYINDHLQEIPQARRGVYLASVRSHMVRISDQLDANGLGRLAWLFLLEGDRQNAKLYAERGLLKEPDNEHCQKFLDRLQA
ncbi:MAG: NB-ARC domain-containing protein [Terracidiphilus sp.]